jgi:tetratricopeptide (TPR) repeat protein
LALPAERQARTLSPATLLEYPAIRLFVERSQAVKPDFTLSDTNAPDIAAVVRRLDGLPLAIELAAARVRVLAPAQLLTRLDQRLKVLTGGQRDLPARQQTLRATIEWSHDLLDPDERALFARLAVFSGGCTFEAAEAVCGAAGDLALDILDGLDSLTQQSLLRAQDGPDDSPRFTMLETIRELALERLEATGDADTLHRAHVDFFLALAEEAEPELTGSDPASWLNRLDSEHDNLRASLGWLNQADNRELRLRLAVALWRFWWTRGYLTEGRGWLDQALVNATDLPLDLRAQAFRGAGILAESQGDYEQATVLHEAALANARQLGDQLEIAKSLTDLGIMARFQSEYGRAAELQEQALPLWRELNDEAGMASSLYELGRLAIERGDFAAATELLHESLTLVRASGDVSMLGPVFESLGELAFHQEDYSQAEAWYERCRVASQEVGDSRMIAHAVAALGEAIHHQGDLERAESLYREALASYRELGEKRGESFALFQMGKVALARDELATARLLLVESLELRQDEGDKSAIIESLEGLAGLASTQSDPTLAALLFGACNALRLAFEAPLPPSYAGERERFLAAARSSLDDADFAAAWNCGQALTLEQAIAEALTLRDQKQFRFAVSKGSSLP